MATMSQRPNGPTGGAVTIGEAASASGVSAKMIRYYEAIGLVRPAPRSASGYRHYTETELHDLRFIRRARDLGFPLDQIAELLALWRDEHRTSAEVKALAVGHANALRHKIGELQAMVRTLSALAERCGGDDRPDCPILDDLADRGAG